MKRIILVLGILTLFFACQKSTTDELGEFQDCADFMDMTKKNLFDQSLFYRDWKLSKYYSETYEDGVLQGTEDLTYKYNGNWLSFYNDGTLNGSKGSGKWMYSHNYLLCKGGSGIMNSYEVIELTPNKLSYKTEVPAPGTIMDFYTPFFKDKSGTHLFLISEYIAIQQN